MSKSRSRNDVLNPCPSCGRRFDTGGCMTYMDYFLEQWSDGNCPGCGTRVVIRVEETYSPEVWEIATTLAEIRAVALGDLELSVRTRNSLRKLGLETVGDLLDTTEAQIREGLAVSDPVIEQIRQLLETKGLALEEAE